MPAYRIGSRSEAAVTAFRWNCRHRLFRFSHSREDALATATLVSTHLPERGFCEQPAIYGHRVPIKRFGRVQREIFSKQSFSIAKRRLFIHASQRHPSGATARALGVLNEVLATLRRQP